MYSKSALVRPWYRSNDTEARNAAARRAYESVLTVTLSRPDNDEYRKFTETVRQTARTSYGYDVFERDEEVRLAIAESAVQKSVFYVPNNRFYLGIPAI